MFCLITLIEEKCFWIAVEKKQKFDDLTKGLDLAESLVLSFPIATAHYDVSKIMSRPDNYQVIRKEGKNGKGRKKHNKEEKIKEIKKLEIDCIGERMLIPLDPDKENGSRSANFTSRTESNTSCQVTRVQVGLKCVEARS